MSTKEKMDFNKKEVLRKQEYRKKQAFLKNNDKKIIVETLNINTDKLKFQKTNIVGHDPPKGTVQYNR